VTLFEAYFPFSYRCECLPFASTMASKFSADESIALIHENLQEVLKPEIIEDVIKNQKRPLVIYWGRESLPISSSPQLNALRMP